MQTAADEVNPCIKLKLNSDGKENLDKMHTKLLDIIKKCDIKSHCSIEKNDAIQVLFILTLEGGMVDFSRINEVRVFFDKFLKNIDLPGEYEFGFLNAKNVKIGDRSTGMLESTGQDLDSILIACRNKGCFNIQEMSD